MQVKAEPGVTELLVSRLCHDLISPVGAVGNGLELLAEDDDSIAEEALALSQQSAKRASFRLQYFRLAFGTAGDRASTSLTELRDLAVGFLDGRKVELNWPMPGAIAPSLPPGGLRVLLAMVILAADSLPRGGAVEVTLGDTATGVDLGVKARGAGARAPDGLAEALAAGADPTGLTTANVVGFLAARLAERLGGRLAMAGSDGNAVAFEAVLRAP